MKEVRVEGERKEVTRGIKRIDEEWKGNGE